MNTPSAAVSNAILALLASVMLATRFHHFGTALNLPDASMAVFFVGGLYLRRHWRFVLFVAFAVAIDWISTSLAGVSDFCVTPAYALLPLAYAVLWYGARAYAPHLRESASSLGLALAVALACASLSFLVSNGAFYWLGGRYASPNVSEYLARAWQWGPMFLRSTLIYIAVALSLHVVVVRTLRAPAAGSGTLRNR